MRDLFQVVIPNNPGLIANIKENALAVSNMFPNMEGEVTKVDLDSLDADTVYNIFDAFRCQYPDIVPTVTVRIPSGYRFVVTPEGEVSETYVQGYRHTVREGLPMDMLRSAKDGRGRKNSRNIVAWFKARGVNTDSTTFQHLMAQWVGAFKRPAVNYRIITDVHEWDMFGNIPNVDLDRSCYSSEQSGCWREAPACLATGFFGQAVCFGMFAYQKGHIVGRAWGVATHGGFLVSNAYWLDTCMQRARGITVDNSIATFVDIVKVASNRPNLRSISVGQDECNGIPAYVNSDATWVHEDLNANQYPSPDYSTNTCPACGNYGRKDGFGFQHAFCDYCTKGITSECPCCNSRMREADLMEACACWNDDPTLRVCRNCNDQNHRVCQGCYHRYCAVDMAEVRAIRQDGWTVGYTRSTVQSFCNECRDGRGYYSGEYDSCNCGFVWVAPLTRANCNTCGTAQGI